MKGLYGQPEISAMGNGFYREGIDCRKNAAFYLCSCDSVMKFSCKINV